MKRSPLPPRKAPLARGAAPRRSAALRQAEAPIRRSRLNPRSAKREAVRDERRAFVEFILRTRPYCEACEHLGKRRAPSVDVHEKLRRSQGSPIVPSQGLTGEDVLAVCRACHDWIGAHPAKAVELGLAVWSWQRDPLPRSDNRGSLPS